ncbi:MAG: hypothetical protein CVU00_15495, partial [Bacteroidetes bacterium HGW-Bacteroidetes-17]
LFGGVASYAFAVGLMLQRVEAAISNEISNIQIHNPDYLVNEEVKFTIEDQENIVSRIKELDGVKAVSSRIKVLAMASTAETGTGIMLNGIDAETEKQVTKLSEQLIEGEYISDQSRIPIVIGQKLALKLNARLKSKIVITTSNTEGVLTYGAFRVVGIYHTDNDMFDEMNVFVRKSELADLLGISNSEVNEIAISLYDYDQSIPIANILKDKFKDEIQQNQLVIRPWTEITPSLNAMIKMMDYFSYIFIIIILIALAFGIVNTMLMVVMERLKELGMLKAIGMNNKRLFSMIMLETIFLSIVGGVFGLLFSYLTILYFGHYGLNLDSIKEGYNAIGFSSVVYPTAAFSFYIGTTGLVIVTAILASIYPARKALKLNPAEAIQQND